MLYCYKSRRLLTDKLIRYKHERVPQRKSGRNNKYQSISCLQDVKEAFFTEVKKPRAILDTLFKKITVSQLFRKSLNIFYAMFAISSAHLAEQRLCTQFSGAIQIVPYSTPSILPTTGSKS